MSYRELKSYQHAEIIYDFTKEFLKRYIDFKSRTTDQMDQAARSGKQNIVEASANPTSERSELKLLGVSRGSFEELLHDYEDFLRQRGLRRWDKNSPKALKVRNLYTSNTSYTSDRANQSNMTNKTNKSNLSNRTYMSYLDNPEDAANAAICLINQINFLVDRQIKAAEEKFVRGGGYAENLRKKREDFKKSKIRFLVILLIGLISPIGPIGLIGLIGFIGFISPVGPIRLIKSAEASATVGNLSCDEFHERPRPDARECETGYMGYWTFDRQTF